MRITAIIEGRVQGVGYRDFVKRSAESFGVHGSVRNLGSGGIEIFAEGSDEEVKRFMDFLKKEKPSAANIEAVEVYGERDKKYRGPWREVRDNFSVDWHNGD